MFLKYSLSHEAVTAVIPATGKPDRQADNLKAGYGPLLTAGSAEGTDRAVRLTQRTFAPAREGAFVIQM